jgi:hypothetical protein
MRHFLFAIVVAVVAAGFITGCKSDTAVTPNGTASVIIPLQAGNWWRFVDSTFAADGSVSSIDSSLLKIVRNDTILYNGAVYPVGEWAWCSVLSGAQDGDAYLLGNGPDGLYEFGMSTHNSSTGLDTLHVIARSLFIKWPAAPGDVWMSDQYSRSNRPDGSTQWKLDSMQSISRCLETQVNLSTPAGNLACMVFRQQQSPADSNGARIYCSPGVGLVCVTMDLGSKYGRQSKTLKSYHVAH